MDKILKQFRRIYSDNGSGDIDFSEQEERLRLATNKLNKATSDLMRASEKLNTVALGIDPLTGKLH